MITVTITVAWRKLNHVIRFDWWLISDSSLFCEVLIWTIDRKASNNFRRDDSNSVSLTIYYKDRNEIYY